MNILQQAISAVRKGVVTLLIEGPAARTGLDRLINRLEKSNQVIEKKLSTATGRQNQQETLTHIIGIERWGQQRLKVALGEPLMTEEYDLYRPELKDWNRLKEVFHATRQETLSLVKSLRMAGVDPSTQVPHNQLGNLTLLGWVYYINMHANIESRKIG